MKVSVIIPYYNPDSDAMTCQLLIRAVRSAWDSLSQVCDCEIVVVNDGSPSHPDLSTVESIPVKYVTIPHRMLGGARNAGMDCASGQIITFLDADDIYFPGTLAPCVKAMEDLDADLLGFGMKRIKQCADTPGTPCGRPVFGKPVTGARFMASHNLYGSACRYLIRRSLITDNGLRFMENAFIEDEEFTPRLMFLAKRYSETTLPVYAYCVREGSIITDSSLSRIDARQADTVKALSHLIAFRNEHAANPHRGLDRKISCLAMDHLRRTLRRTDWRTALPIQVRALKDLGVWPLKGCYSVRFCLFKYLSRCKTGLRILHLTERFYK